MTPERTIEEWRPVYWCPDFYEVSNQGRVRRMSPYRSTNTGRVLRAVLNGGYPIVWLSVRGERKREHIHALVAAAFIGPRPPGLSINHRNGIKTDNVPGNLEYVTPGENVRHAFAMGLMHAARGDKHGFRKHPELIVRGVRQPNAKLTDDAVREIRKRYVSGESQRTLARCFGVDQSVVSLVVHRKRWAHVV